MNTRITDISFISGAVQSIKLKHILVIVFLLRIVFFAVVYNNFADSFGWERDDNYDEIALNVIQGNGYRVHTTDPPNTVRPPLYTFFLMTVFVLFGQARWKIVTFQALLQVMTCYLLYRLTKKMTGSTTAARVAAILFAVYPQSMLYSSMFLTESLFTLLLVIVALAYLNLVRNNDGWRSMVLGAVLGLSALTRPVSMLLIVPMVLLYLTKTKQVGFQSRAFNSVVVIMTFVVILIPWTVRNYQITGKIIPVSSRGGHFLYSNTISSRQEEVENQVQEFGVADNSDPEGRDGKYLAMAVKNILGRPHMFIGNTVRTALDFWYRGHSLTISVFNGIINFSLLFFAALGILLYRQRWGVLLTPILLMVLYFNMCYGLLHAISRYSFPIMPFIMLYAAFFFHSHSRTGRNAAKQEY